MFSSHRHHVIFLALGFQVFPVLGQQLKASGEDSSYPFFDRLRACRIGKHIWVEGINSPGKGNFGFLLEAYSETAIELRANVLDPTRLREQRIPFEIGSGSMIPKVIAVKDGKVPAEQVLSAQTWINSQYIKLER